MEFYLLKLRKAIHVAPLSVGAELWRQLDSLDTPTPEKIP